MLALILGAVAVVGMVLIVLGLLYWSKIVDWFKGRQQLKQSDKDSIAFTIQQKMETGEFKTVQGIFNTDSNELLDGVQYQSDNIDEKLAELHRKDELVVYN
jgi:hypothetical protein